MIFSPVLRRNAFNPQAADLALQRFLQGTLGTAAHSPTSVQVQRSSGFSRLDSSAVAALRKWRFKPYVLNGRPIAVTAPIPIEFTLND